MPAPEQLSEFPDHAWRTATPAEAAMDEGLLSMAVARITSGEIRDIDALLVVRHGRMVLERYFGDSHRDDLHTMQSVSKSVTSLVVGAAVADGLLSLDDRVLATLPQPYRVVANAEPRKANITVAHLLGMRSGINFHESPYPGSPLERLNNSSGDWTTHALAEPMNADPGARWQYNSGGVIALAAVVRAASGESFQSYAARRLFTPIGIDRVRWAASPFDNLAHAGGGLQLRAVDLARIGHLMLHRGRWNGHQVVPSSWIDASINIGTRGAIRYAGESLDYGMLWYTMPLQRGAPETDFASRIIAAAGNMTQWLFVVPKHGLVMVVTGRGNQSFPAPIDLLRRQVIPAAH